MRDKSDDRLMALIGMMGSATSAGDHEAVSAFRMASKLMRRRGITWNDVAERAFRAQPRGAATGRQPDPHAARQAQRDEERRREAREEADRAARAEARERERERNARDASDAAAARPRRRMQGFDVPPVVQGVVRLIDQGQLAMLIFEVEDEAAGVTYGPIQASDDGLRNGLLACLGRCAAITVRAPRTAGAMPACMGWKPIWN